MDYDVIIHSIICAWLVLVFVIFLLFVIVD